jgi:aminoglycoside phosphotransferase (APT) family kinase protein
VWGVEVTRPNADTRAWVADVVGAGRVVGARRLTGGLTSVVHVVTLEDARGRRERVVLRRYTQPDVDEMSAHIDQEAAILSQLARTTIPAPELIAADAAGEHTGGVPSLVMTRLRGRMDLAPKDPGRFVREMAVRLVEIHDVSVVARLFDRAVVPAADRIPSATTDRPMWERALDLMRSGKAPYVPRFLHRDYQHFNMLWFRGRLTGIADWPFASMGPRETDVGHCRLNLAVLFSAEWAEHFRLAYEAEAGYVTDPWWDIDAIFSFHDVWHEFIPLQVSGRIAVDLDGMCRRVDELLAAALARV